MSGVNKNNGKPMFSQGSKYNVSMFTRLPNNMTGMRAHFMKQAAAVTSLDPAVIKAAAMNKLTGGPMTKGGKRRATRRATRRKARSYKKKTARK